MDEREKTDWDGTWNRIIEGMWQEEVRMERARSGVAVVPPTFAGIAPGTLLNPHDYPISANDVERELKQTFISNHSHAYSYVSMLDGICDLSELPQPKLNQEVNKVSTIKYEDITIGLPLYGLRVMINPERFGNYPSDIHGLSGNILNVQGSDSSIRDVIRTYKRDGKYEGSWKVVIKFDNGKTLKSIKVRDLLPIASGYQNVYHYYTREGESYVLEKDLPDFLDEFLIKKGQSVSLNRIFDEEYCRKIFDKA